MAKAGTNAAPTVENRGRADNAKSWDSGEAGRGPCRFQGLESQVKLGP